MTQRWDFPSEQNRYLENHIARLLRSFSHWTGKSLIPSSAKMEERARQIFFAPFVVLSHNTAPDPLLNYANQRALELFELSWNELMSLPSRQTAEPNKQADRQRLLARVAQHGYIDDYRGVRVTKSGRRFLIERATVWNLLDEHQGFYGQAATFDDWKFLN